MSVFLPIFFFLAIHITGCVEDSGISKNSREVMVTPQDELSTASLVQKVTGHSEPEVPGFFSSAGEREEYEQWQTLKAIADWYRLLVEFNLAYRNHDGKDLDTVKLVEKVTGLRESPDPGFFSSSYGRMPHNHWHRLKARADRMKLLKSLDPSIDMKTLAEKVVAMEEGRNSDPDSEASGAWIDESASSQIFAPYRPDAYGPGVNADATGRPFIWKPDTAGPRVFDPFLRVQPDMYGPGIGMDQYGRPMRPACPRGWAGPC
ncbi:MAG: hypothetical protein R3B37_08565 [Nitrospira sp.]|nr:hypothetical protein [Nitrospira sp.]